MKVWPKALKVFKTAFDFALTESGRMVRPFSNGPEVRAVSTTPNGLMSRKDSGRARL